MALPGAHKPLQSKARGAGALPRYPSGQQEGHRTSEPEPVAPPCPQAERGGRALAPGAGTPCARLCEGSPGCAQEQVGD